MKFVHYGQSDKTTGGSSLEGDITRTIAWELRASYGADLFVFCGFVNRSFSRWMAGGMPEWYKSLGIEAKRNYEDGRLSSLPLTHRESPGDGQVVFPKGYGGMKEHWIDNHDGTFSLHVQYHPGPEDLRFVAECDRDYLNTLLWGPERRILPNVFPDTSKLRDTEPGVWLLWLRANCPPDLGTWYMAQLELPNIQEIVEAADKECKDWSKAQKTQYEQSAREAQAKAARLTQLRAKLTTLIPAVMKVLQPLEATKQYILLPAAEVSGLQKFMSNLTTLQPQALDEAQLTTAIRELEIWQPYVNSLPAKIAAEQETRRRIAELRIKLQALHSEVTKILDPIEARNEIQLLPQDEQSTYRDFISHLRSFQPDTLDEAQLKEAIRVLETWQPYVNSLPAKIAAEQETRRRIAELRIKLQALHSEVTKILDPIEARDEIQLLPQDEQSTYRDFISHLRSFQPDTLDEAGLIEAIRELEIWQPYVNSLPAKIAAEQETCRRLAELRTKLQVFLSKAASILDPIEARNEIQLLPQDEQSTYHDFISHLRSFQPDTLNEAGLQSAISFIESKQRYLTTVQQKTAELAKKRAKKVAALEEKIHKLHLKIEAAALASNYEKILESYVFIRDYYRSIVTLGIDCSKQLAELELKIKEAQGKLSPSVTPLQTLSSSAISPQAAVAASSPSPEQLRCRVIPHAELQLNQELGSGAFGTVYRGLWRTENIAVKKLHSAQLTPNSRQAFISEVEIMTKLDSERLVRLYGACVAPDPYCIVMEYMPRGSLYTLLHSSEQYSWHVALQIATDIGSGLAFLHHEKVLHRDLKSLNVLLDSQYRAKICDFGLSKVRQEVSVTSTRPGTAVGTNAWNAPELFGLRPKYSCASDIYAYGMILWEILTRETPYKDVLDPNEIKSAVKAGEREEIPATCSATYRDTIERCWAQVPEHRPQALQVVQALQSEFTTTMAKSWHIAPELKPHSRNQAGYFLIPAGASDKQKVVAAYERSPVPGMEVGRVTIIFNPVLNKSFADGIELLEGRFENPAFAATWDTDGDATTVAWRREVIRRFEAMAHPYQDPDCKHVKILPVWHGTRAAIVESIAKTGYANLATTDMGFFGKGLYGSYEAEYAHRVYGPGQHGAQGTLLVNWIACFAPYPVVGYQVPGYTGMVPDATDDPGDMVQLMRGGNIGSYDAHVVPVRPSKMNPEASYYPCRPQEPATYHEVVVFETARILPRYIVELQPSLVAPPPVAPLLAAAGMFGTKPEQKAAAPAPAPTP